MILSRIAKALKDQNWLAVGIEFVIVILGVVIGFQVTVWNAGRVAEAREVAILDRLRDELAVDQAERQQSRNNASRLALLRDGYARAGSDEADFDARLWLLLHRYSILFGPASGEGRGWQLATPPRAMEQLGADFDVTAECFASPLNRRHARYCRLAP